MALMVCGAMMAKEYHFGVEAGYDYKHYLLVSNIPGVSVSNTGLNGFHIGGNFQCDFLDGKNIPSITLGLNYQFAGAEDQSKEYKTAKKEFKEFYKGQSPCFMDYESQHTLQIPLRARYTHVFDHDVSLFVFTGPQLGFMVGYTTSQKEWFTNDGKKTGIYNYSEVISGNYKSQVWVNGDKVATKGRLDKDDRFTEWFELSWGLGVGVAWKNLSLSLSYDLGAINHASDFEKISKEHDSDSYYNLTGNSLEVTIGYRLK